MAKKVTLSKTFANDAEYQHFKSLYDANTSAFESVWHCEVEGGEGDQAPEVPEAAPAETPTPSAPPAEGETPATTPESFYKAA